MNRTEPMRERPLRSLDGYLAAALGILLIGGIVWSYTRSDMQSLVDFLWRVPLQLIGIALVAGLYMLQPNQAAILTLFGRYAGTDRSEGLRWANPFYRKRRLSCRARNLNTAMLKVNDRRGNPVEISAVVVWRIVDTARAVFDVDDFELFVKVQAEAALRHLASQYAYDEGDSIDAGEPTLRSSMDAVSATLRDELQERFAAAGVEVVDARLSHLAYAPEIAQVMLRRQQAEAIIAARQKIVLGAVSMVESALNGLSERGIVQLDDERKAAMVSNLLVVLCSDRDTQPVVNAGTLYH